MRNEILMFGAGALTLAVIATLVAAFYTVEQRTSAIVQRFGKFVREAGPGLHVKIPFIDRVIGRINLSVQQLDVQIETKTADNVFVDIVVRVQYCVLPDKVYDAFYKLDGATRQIDWLVVDVVRSRVRKIKLHELLETRNEIADFARRELAPVMQNYGYGILKALTTDILITDRVRRAAAERGEADRIPNVEAAEPDAHSKTRSEASPGNPRPNGDPAHGAESHRG